MEKVVIYTMINDKKNYISETIKLFNGKYTPGYSKDIKEALTFDDAIAANKVINSLRDLHDRKFILGATLHADRQKSFSTYQRLQEKNELN